MKDSIVEKLKNLSRAKSYSEQDVVYFLVECCKLLEQVNKLDKFRVIRFYRNWSCHSCISKDAEKIFEEIYIIIKAKKYLKLEKREEGEIPAFAELVDDMVTKSLDNYSFIKLKEEVKRFAGDFLNNEVLNWKSFEEQLHHIIADTPLIIKKGKQEIFKFWLRESNREEPFKGVTVQFSYPGGWTGGGTRDKLFKF